MNKPRGFTLIEVMVALAVFAVIASSVVLVNTRAISNAALLENRLFGLWVAENKMAELRISGAPPINEYENEVSNFGREWVVRWTVEDAESADYGAYVRRVTVRSFLAQGDELSDVASIVALIQVPL
ncbi:type II secretion system minor pseudopilin GspI [Salinispirillum sp. LH 10-3-1]|uniref:Type II secretion system protein I n=1 Tax=Salinispirillum sp. LH 10-3-1 TaxID=2952525 RepID=A0AB38YBA1_9GAMM